MKPNERHVDADKSSAGGAWAWQLGFCAAFLLFAGMMADDPAPWGALLAVLGFWLVLLWLDDLLMRRWKLALKAVLGLGLLALFWPGDGCDGEDEC